MCTVYAQKNQHNYIYEMQRIQANHLKIKKTTLEYTVLIFSMKTMRD